MGRKFIKIVKIGPVNYFELKIAGFVCIDEDIFLYLILILSRKRKKMRDRNEVVGRRGGYLTLTVLSLDCRIRWKEVPIF